MNFLKFLLIILFIPFVAKTQETMIHFPDSLFTPYYHQRVSHFKTLPHSKRDIVFLGNSITDGAEWSELFEDVHIKNRGISGDVSAGVLNRLDEILATPPAKIFLLIGINDFARNLSTDSVWKNYQAIIRQIKNKSSYTKLYIQSVLPVTDFYKSKSGHITKNDSVNKFNSLLQAEQKKYGYTFINLHDAFCDAGGKLNPVLTNDGLHLKGEGYILWKHLIYPYVYDVEEKPALIPYPKKIEWTKNIFPLWRANPVVVSDTALLTFNFYELLNRRINTVLPSKYQNNNIPYIKISFEKVDVPLLEDEAYQIHVDSNIVEIKANTSKGIFYALQTFKQLARDKNLIDGCNITDYPSFAWRAYMTNVGRNYESLDLLKQQIDVMSHYKLNVFHFHVTEDIAWRWQIKQYPQLTAPENLLRDKGLYYTVDDIKELIKYCNDRFITFVPELDMPGHSAAFTRVFGYNMQSDSGKKVLKNILQEIFQTYSFPYFHIGGDEVKITDTSFIPFVENMVLQNHLQIIGWQPGGNLGKKVIRQLWIGNEKTKAGFRYIDSRHLYINHFDPFESVVTIFNRRIGDVDEQTNEVLGGELCLWHDRRVANENDLLQMNPVYPSMLAFAEKVWNGNGSNGYITNINTGSEQQKINFSLFENRLLEHKKLYFQHLPFSYYKQSNSVWKLIGAFNNNGNLSSSFYPEKINFETLFDTASTTATGNTIILRHWWDPMVKGILPHLQENTTWYALRKIWSDEDEIKYFWIGFNNFSRATATNSPALNSWDEKQSCIWVNGKLIEPPHWKRAGQKGNLEIPLIDEGYEYRKPTEILLHKGWNNVLVKLPVGSFKGVNYQNPVKWMFTFSPVNVDD